MAEKGKRRKYGSGSIVKRGDIYYIYHTRYGKVKGESLGTKNRIEAERLARERLKQIDQELAAPLDEDSIFGPQAEAEYERQRQYQIYLDDLEEERIEHEMQEAPKRWEQERLEAERRQREYKNPRLDEFWKLGDTKDEDTGLFPEWCKAGHRSPNTVIAYRTAWRRFVEGVEPLPERLRDIGKEHVQAFLSHCRKQKLSQAAMRQYLVSLQGMMSTAITEDWLQGHNPIRMKWRVKRDRIAKYLSKEEVTRLLEAAKATERNVYLFIAIAVHTGMRKDEVAHIRWEDIQFERKNPKTGNPEPVVVLQARDAKPKEGIQAFRLKSNAARIIPLKSELATILEPYRQSKGYIIQSVTGDREIKRTRYNLPAQYTEATEKAGVTCNPHMLRHTFASHAAIAGESIYKISRWLGHSSVQLTADTYAHLQEYDDGINNF